MGLIFIVLILIVLGFGAYKNPIFLLALMAIISVGIYRYIYM